MANVHVSWLELDTNATPCDVKVSWVCMDTAVSSSASKSGVSRLWLIEYYTREWEKKQVAALEALPVAAKRNAVKKAAVLRDVEVERLVVKAEADLEVLTQGVRDIAAAQRFTQALIQQVQRQPEPETDFMQVADAYRKRMHRDDDELLLLSMVI